MNTVTLIGRIAGTPKFTPKVLVGGKVISAKCTMAIIENDRDNKNTFNITAWGNSAHYLARGGAVGKEVTIFGRLNSYPGRVWKDMGPGQPRQPYMEATGPVLVDKIGIIVDNIHWGADSGKTIAQEIQDFQNSQGRAGRPAFWQIPGHNDNAIWKQICESRKAIKFQPGMTHYGYAVVVLHQGQQVVPEDTPTGAVVGNNAGFQGNANTNNFVNGGGHQGGFQGNMNGGQTGAFQGGFQGNTDGYNMPVDNTVVYQGQNMGQVYTGTGQVQGNASAVRGGFQGNTTQAQYQGNNSGYAPRDAGIANGGFTASGPVQM